MTTSDYVRLPEHQTAKCDQCGGPTVILEGRRLAPLWKATGTGKLLCDDCYKARHA